MDNKVKIAIAKAILEIIFFILILTLIAKHIDKNIIDCKRSMLSIQSTLYHIQAKEYEMQAQFVDSYVCLKMALHAEGLGDKDPEKIKKLKDEIFEMKVIRNIKGDETQ